MSKKPARKTYKSSVRRTRRKHKSLAARSIIIVAGFMILVGSVLYGLYSLKNEVALKNNGVQNEILNARIEEVDKLLYEIFFKLGISKKDILKKSTHKNNKNGLEWNTRKQIIKLNKFYSKDEVTRIFNRLTAVGDTSFNIKSKNGSYTTEIDIDGYNTHAVNFIYKKPEVLPVKTEKKPAPDIYSNKKPKISIIVDDIGIDKKAIDQLIDISNDLTFAVLPNRLHTLYAAEKAKSNNMDILLHQPMEPRLDSGYSADDAGEGVLLVGQPKEDIVKTLNSNLSSIPNVVGVNNHMGSKFTESDELMLLVMRNLKQKDLIFVDSLTSPNSKGYSTAKKIGLRAAKRDIFLDEKKKGKSYVKKQLRKLVSKAHKKGYAIGICHTYPQTIEALKEEIPNISKEVNIIPINKLYN